MTGANAIIEHTFKQAIKTENMIEIFLSTGFNLLTIIKSASYISLLRRFRILPDGTR